MLFPEENTKVQQDIPSNILEVSKSGKKPKLWLYCWPNSDESMLSKVVPLFVLNNFILFQQKKEVFSGIFFRFLGNC